MAASCWMLRCLIPAMRGCRRCDRPQAARRFGGRLRHHWHWCGGRERRILLAAAVSDPSSGAGIGAVSGRKLLDAAVSATNYGVGAGVATGRKLRDASVADTSTGTGARVVSGRSLLDAAVSDTSSGVWRWRWRCE